MRVREDRAPLQDVVHGQGIQTKRGAQGSAAPFEALLQEKTQADSHAVLSRLLEQITEQGELIARRREINDVRKYRSLVSDFLDEAMRSTYRTDREGSFDSRGRFKEYSVVRKINEELESLTQQTLDDQKDNLTILDQLGTIRGLLIDLMI